VEQLGAQSMTRYGGQWWAIRFGTCDSIGKFAVNALKCVVRRRVPYVVTAWIKRAAPAQSYRQQGCRAGARQPQRSVSSRTLTAERSVVAG